MNKEQRRRMAWRGFTGAGEESGQADINYTIQVSGKRVEMHREWPEEWDNEDGTDRDIGHECWIMSLDDLKKMVTNAQWCIEKSEAFEKAHPQESEPQ